MKDSNNETSFLPKKDNNNDLNKICVTHDVSQISFVSLAQRYIQRVGLFKPMALSATVVAGQYFITHQAPRGTADLNFALFTTFMDNYNTDVVFCTIVCALLVNWVVFSSPQTYPSQLIKINVNVPIVIFCYALYLSVVLFLFYVYISNL